MKILGLGWKEGDPVPLVGWVVIGTISGLIAVTVGAFTSLAFYYFRGLLATLLYYVYPDWVGYHADIAWLLGFTTGVVISLVKQKRSQRVSERKPSGTKVEKNEEQHSGPVPAISVNDVVKRTLVGSGVGLVLGLLLALWLEMLFFSVSLSPVGPTSWKAAVSTERRRERRSMHEREKDEMVMSSSHPLFRYLFVVPVCAMPVVGATVGGGAALRSWLKR
jgi:hypothetical protein